MTWRASLTQPAASPRPGPGPPWPSVSVVVPTRDRPELLRRALNSILSQEYAGEIECLVVFDQEEPDHGVEARGPLRSVRVLANERTPGLAGARNTGAFTARRELLAFCDDDDEWLPERISAQVKLLSSHPSSHTVSCGIFVSCGRRTVERVLPGIGIAFRELLRDRVMELHPSTILVRRESFLRVVGPLDEALPGGYGEDYDWLLRSARDQAILVVARPLVRVFWHRASWFAEGWEAIAAGCEYLLDKYPEFYDHPEGLARLCGKIAFAHAAAGHGELARQWSRRSATACVWEPRAYLAFLTSLGVVRAPAIVSALNRVGRGI